MAIPLIVALIGFGLTAGAAVLVWHKILNWAENSIFPWFEKHLPTIAPYVRKAFSKIDDVAANLRLQTREAWKKVTQYLLKQVVVINRKTDDTWVGQVTSWVIENSNYNDKPVVKQVTTEQNVPWDELPGDVRQKFLTQGEKSFEKDITQIRDKEMAEMAMSN